MEERQSKNLIGAADEMPADKYGYRPTPEQMTFAHLIMHIAEANNIVCALASPANRRTRRKAERERFQRHADQGAERFLRLL